jgi:hypothetical protein
MSLFKPRHTVQSVANELISGLKDGTITLDREKTCLPVHLVDLLTFSDAPVTLRVIEAPRRVSNASTRLEWPAEIIRLTFGSQLAVHAAVKPSAR